MQDRARFRRPRARASPAGAVGPPAAASRCALRRAGAGATAAGALRCLRGCPSLRALRGGRFPTGFSRRPRRFFLRPLPEPFSGAARFFSREWAGQNATRRRTLMPSRTSIRSTPAHPSWCVRPALPMPPTPAPADTLVASPSRLGRQVHAIANAKLYRIGSESVGTDV